MILSLSAVVGKKYEEDEERWVSVPRLKEACVMRGQHLLVTPS
jgi:hypothetical protein